ncbi:MAG: hemerythrin domain-containing protein [Hyphomicrobiales bacterium]
MRYEHELQNKLCDALERVADGLPENVDRTLVTAILPMLRNDLEIHVMDEEDGLFPLMQERVVAEDNFDAVLETLCLEHAADQGFAEEIVDQLEQLNACSRPENPDMLGYMLRGFFEAQRRHLAWENAVVLPLAHCRLTKPDLNALTRVMLDNRKSRRPRLVRPSVVLFEV